MAGLEAGLSWDRLARIRLPREWRGALTWGMALAGLALAAATLAIMGPFGRGLQGQALRLVLLADLTYLILIIAFIVARMARLITDRRRAGPASRLHGRLVAIFGGLALIPTVLVALFAGFLVNIGLEGWFSDRVQQVVTTSQAAAEAY
ncbi:MAG: PAS domain-containing sensor histidine kinase, partial [Pseudomonadota bacterium]|nr:PAS domain-containing sensor histidine kinase [Pseudomonadota bacterium]